METTVAGQSGFRCVPTRPSRLGFGGFGLAGVFGAFDREDALASIHHALARGINVVDVARAYGPAEAILGEALRRWDGPAPIVATKVSAVGPVTQWGLPPSVDEVFPRGHVTESTHRSLREIGVETLDLQQLHLYWPNWGVGGYWLEELLALRDAGKVRAIGVSLPDQRHDVGLPLVLSGTIDSVQTVINVFDPQAFDSLVPACTERGVAVIARCVLDEGGLTGTLTRDSTFGDGDYRAGYFDQGPRDRYIQRVDALRAFIPRAAGSLASLALKFVIGHPGVTTAVVSMHRRDLVDANLAALSEAPLSVEDWETLRRRHRWVRNFYNAKVM